MTTGPLGTARAFNYRKAAWIAIQAAPLGFLTGLSERQGIKKAIRTGVYAAAFGAAFGGANGGYVKRATAEKIEFPAVNWSYDPL